MNKFLLKCLMAPAEESGTVDGMPDAGGMELGESEQEFADLMQEINADGVEEPAKEEAAEPEGAEEGAPAEEGKSEEGKEEDPKPAVEEETPPADPAKPAEEEKPVVEEDPEVAAQARQAFLADVEKSFEISDDDANMLLTEPEKVLPKLGAMVYDRAMQDVAHLLQQQQQQLAQTLPQIITQTQQAASQEDTARATFLEVNPGLDKVGNLNDLVDALAPTVMQANPGKSGKELMGIIGDMVYPMVGMARPAATPPEQPAPTKVKPHVPAAPSAPSAVLPSPVPEGEDPIITELLAMDN